MVLFLFAVYSHGQILPKPIQSILQSDPKLNSVEIIQNCPGKNTRRNALGECECETGFPYGDPNTNQGCWRCLLDCHDNAYCAHPGVCKCNESYVGDGTKQCNPIAPKIISIYPKKGSPDGGTLVTIHYEISQMPAYKTLLCRFGEIPIQATNYTNTTVTCKSPPRLSKVVNVSISFGGLHWSKEPFQFRYTNNRAILKYIPIASSLLIFAVFYIFYTKKGRKTRSHDRGENEPFLSSLARHNDQVKRRKNIL